MIVKNNIVVYDSSVQLKIDGAYGKNFRDSTTRLDNAIFYDIPVPKPFFGNGYIFNPIDKTFSLTESGLEKFKEYLRNNLKEHKKRIEYGGIVLEDGKQIKTDLTSQQYINGMFNTTILNPNIKVSFKYADGTWELIEKDRIEEIALKVSQHVEACFMREYQLIEDIENATNLNECRNVENNIIQDWPSN